MAKKLTFYAIIKRSDYGAFNTTFGDPKFYEQSDNPKVEQIAE